MWRTLPPSAIKRNQGHLTSFSCYRAKYRSLPPPLSQYTYGRSLLYPNKVWTPPPPPLPTPALATTTTTATLPPSSRVVWFAPCLSFPLLLFSLRRRGERERLLSLLLPFPQCFLLFPPPPFPALRSLSLFPLPLSSPPTASSTLASIIMIMPGDRRTDGRKDRKGGGASVDAAQHVWEGAARKDT